MISTNSSTFEQWLPTGLAARTFGVSHDSLKRYADRDCFLIECKHWRRGVHPNSPRLWNMSACAEALAYRGRLRRQPVDEASL